MISWLITDLKFSYLIIPIIIIWFITFVNAEENERGERGIWLFVATTILGGLSSLIIILEAVSANHVSESTEPWRQIYGNELNAPVSLSISRKYLKVGNRLSDGDRDVLYTMSRTGNDTTITIGDDSDSSTRKVRVTQIEGDLKKDAIITKIEYRKATTFHYRVFGLDGNSQPADNDGDIRITLGSPSNSTNALFGD